MPETMSLSTTPVTGNPAEWQAENPVNGNALDPKAGQGFSEILPEYLNAVETTELQEEETQAVVAMLLMPPQTPNGNTLPVDPPPSGTDQELGGTDNARRVQALLNERAASQLLAENSPDGSASVESAADLVRTGEFVPQGEGLQQELFPGIENSAKDPVAEDALDPETSQLLAGNSPDGTAPVEGAKSPRYPSFPTLPDLSEGIAPVKGAWDKAEELGGIDGDVTPSNKMLDVPSLGVTEWRWLSSPLGQKLDLVQSQPMGSRELSSPLIPVATPFHEENWGQDFASRIAWQVGEAIQEAQIQLNPPELGPIEVRVRVNEDQAAVHFHTHHGQVRDAIEKAIPELREILSQSGLHLADANVSLGSSGQERSGAGRTTPQPFDFMGNDYQGENQHAVPLPPSRLREGLIDAYV